MYQSKKQLTAEEVYRAKEKNQKRRDKKKQAGVRAKEEAILPCLENTTKKDKKKEHSMPEDKPDGELVSNEWAKYLATDGKWLTTSYCEVKELNAGWPWVGAPPELLTQAPYAVNEHNFDAGFFTLPQEVQVSYLYDGGRTSANYVRPLLYSTFLGEWKPRFSRSYLNITAVQANSPRHANQHSTWYHPTLTTGTFPEADLTVAIRILRVGLIPLVQSIRLWLSAHSGSAVGEARTSSAPCTVYRI